MQMIRTLGLGLLAGVVCTMAAASLVLPSIQADEAKADTRVYELRTYYALPGRLDALHARFKNHTIRLFEKHGMKNLMYWVPTDPEKGKDTLIYVLEHRSAAAAEESWKAFRADPEWLKVKGESEQSGPIVAKADSVMMKAVDYSPHLKQK